MEKSKKPSTIEALKEDVYFQINNIKGWLSVNDYECALIKAKCLVDALQEIVSASNRKL